VFNDISRQEFLSHYWQKQPYVFRSAFDDFVDPINPEELAGLSLESDVESRLIQQRGSAWSVENGPLTSEYFESLPASHWTLLVQSVDYWAPETAALMQPFNFIPNWRRDDLMISFATANGGVGPHIDQYDVFLIQGLGRRHWKVGQPNAETESFTPHPCLKQIKPFDSILDVCLNPGDVLYIPPNTPHDGVALEDCLTYSVGFRAPSRQMLLEQLLLDQLAEDESSSHRYKDHDLSTVKGQQLPSSAIEWSKQALTGITEQQIMNAFGKLVTRPKFPPEESLDDIEQIKKSLLSEPTQLHVCADCRWTFHQTEHSFSLYANGETYEFKPEYATFLINLFENGYWDTKNVNISLQDVEFTNRIANLVFNGCLFFKH